jgi:mono/diheme cytochrome c family protein
MDTSLVLAQAAGGSGAAGEASSGGGAASAIGWAIAILLIIGFAVALFINSRQSRPEVGAELELAANRKPYLSDDELEGKKLDRTLGAGLVLLAFVSISLPLYWLYEPARQEGAVEKFQEEAVTFGKAVYDTKANCASCHGPEGVGGVASTSLLTEGGQFVKTVSWQAPALNTVLYRFSREEVKDVLEYGRPSTPMPAWGAKGGGPLTDQQLDNVIAYLYSIQLPADEAKSKLNEEIEKVCKPDAAGRCTVPYDPNSPPTARVRYATLGEALFNLGLYSGFQGGAYSCGRCHTAGWSYGDPGIPGAGGRSGFSLAGQKAHFETAAAQAEFVGTGSENGKKIGSGPNGSGRMPGFGENPNVDPADGLPMNADQVMYTPDQIQAITEYERSLG